MNDRLEDLFPRLRHGGYGTTSPEDPGYNCIAWAAGDTSRWWEPDPLPFRFWPDGVRREYTLEAYADAFRRLGFEDCADPRLEEGVEKVAIYAREDGSPTHAARQLSDGSWTSKLGRLQDIVHAKLDQVAGVAYGRPVLFLRRRRPPGPPEEANP